ncbi:MFS transporter, partial [Falsiroseomonas sp.]|uniref:MFS transporter n=1 Tax=Falsiroseomonas sp. TaxID=2870721 RepID=UPI00271AEC70
MAEETGKPPGWRRSIVRIFLCLGLAAILSQFFRSATGVIAPDLMRDLSLSASQMGLLTAAFFITFAITQIPTGILLDRYGSRLTIAGTMLFAVAGSVVFYLAQTYWHVVIARTLIGIGCAGVMMGAFAVLARWFDARSFTMTIGWMIALSNGGNLLATTPMALATEAIGWRGTYLVMAVVTLLVVIGVLLGVRDAPPGHKFLTRRSESGADIIGGLKAVFRNPQLP